MSKILQKTSIIVAAPHHGITYINRAASSDDVYGVIKSRLHTSGSGSGSWILNERIIVTFHENYSATLLLARNVVIQTTSAAVEY